MTAPDPMPLVERLRKTAHAMDWGYATSADNVPLPDVLRKVADEIERLTAALEAEKAEVFRLQASHSALYAEVEALRDALAQAKGVPEPQLIDFEVAHRIAYQAAAAFRPPYFGGSGFRAHTWVVEAIRSAHMDGQRFATGGPVMLDRGATPPSPAQAAGWRDIESAPRDVEALFWVVPKEPEECPVNTCGMAITCDFKPYRHFGRYGTWGGLSKATHWMSLPAAPGHPPSERQGLTKEQIDFILSDSFLAANGSVYSTRVYDFVQAIERAHGIGTAPAPNESEG